MLEQIVEQFLENPEEINAIKILNEILREENYNLGEFLGNYLEKLFPFSFIIKEKYALILYYLNNFEKAYEIYEKILNMKGLSEELSYKISYNQHFCIDKIQSRFIYYNPEKIRKIIENKEENNPFPLITLSITSCKRFDLFQKTINSFINCCEDLHLISRWICIDDNSSEEDRNKMISMYPFFEFGLKPLELKGHPKSMNMIIDTVNTPYLFHMEDDWMFFNKRNYITDCLDVLSQRDDIKQCLINKNYGETAETINIKGGEFHVTLNGLRYYIHEMPNSEEEKEKWIMKHGANVCHCNYWPHFSFRPSLIKTSIFKTLGSFDENVSHFEMDYSRRYISKGWVSAFLEGIYCIHIGRLTSERFDNDKLNAYDLNEEVQFTAKEKKVSLNDFDLNLKTFVVNLDRREDRWQKFQENAKNIISFLNYERFSAV